MLVNGTPSGTASPSIPPHSWWCEGSMLVNGTPSGTASP
eukprot:COSAG02_NODE_73292_length_174_cov_1.813333_1_plen_38_part_10